MVIRILALWVALVSLSLTQSEAAGTPVIAAFGDSLIAGFGVKPEDAFPAQLEQKLTMDGHPVKVLNDGVTGDTTADGLARVQTVLLQHPDWVIIEFGENDLMRGIPPTDVKRNLDDIMNHFKQANIKMILTGIKPPATVGKEYQDAFSALYSDLAKQYGAVFYPDFLGKVYGVAALVQQDGMHPTSTGVSLIVGDVAASYEWANK